MRSATRRVVQRSVEYPAASAPFTRSWISASFRDRDNFGGRPGMRRGRRPLRPCSRYVWYHRKTELTDAPSHRATADRFLPVLSNWMACRRRLSSRCGVP
jgi:hypothetical protein